AEWRSDSFFEHLMVEKTIPKWEGVRDGRWKYARYFEQNPPYEFLHDLQADPDELRNLAGSPDHAERLQRLRSRCEALREALASGSPR
ncbi:MAG TPA: sulfatase/phosphatase domain-containing protein, partial [Planctomycetota bacterium]|nr:sulfatase/phosphatase domain-containing protein [Planctomycetota bacterium]